MNNDLPVTSLWEVEWNFANCWRTLTILLILVFLLQMSIMLSHYWHWLIPLRREIEQEMGEGAVIAPPILWTFAYHFAVTAIVAVVGMGTAQNIAYNNAPTLLTYLGPPLIFVMTVVASQFLKYYSHNLAEGYRRSHR